MDVKSSLRMPIKKSVYRDFLMHVAYTFVCVFAKVCKCHE